jgi:two-component system cell cycle response regulator
MQSGGKVLLALNDASEARTIAERLSKNRVETVTASDGIVALALVGDAKPDLVLCSKSLAKMDGLEVCRLIKRNHKLKHVAVLIILDDGDDSAVVASLEVGANDYLFRPLHMAELVAAVRSHLQNKTSIARLKDDNKELATILEIAEMLTSTLSSADLFYIIVHKVAEALAVERCMLLRVDPSGARATIESSTNPDDADRPHVVVSDLPEVRRALAGNRMVYIEDVRRDAETAAAHDTDNPLSVIAVPFQMRQATEGRVVFHIARASDPFTYREIKFCQIVTTVAANALENAQLYESLEIAHATLTEVAKKDPLTEVFNRRYLFERLDAEVSRAVRKRTSLACIMLDIDHFKRINDEFGHQVGDTVLIGAAKILKDCLRGQDLVGRYGGEEFLVVLPETDVEGAALVAERIRKEVRQHAFEGLAGRRVTVSLGVAVREPGESSGGVELLIAHADRALYEAKNSGRDRTVQHVPVLAAADPIEAR